MNQAAAANQLLMIAELEKHQYFVQAIEISKFDDGRIVYRAVLKPEQQHFIANGFLWLTVHFPDPPEFNRPYGWHELEALPVWLAGHKIVRPKLQDMPPARLRLVG